MDINEKSAIAYLFNVMSVNMLDEEESQKFEGETYMLLNPMDRYCEAKGRKEGKEEGRKEGKLEVAEKMLENGFKVEDIVGITGLSEEQILNGK